jgi:hypothetical protein
MTQWASLRVRRAARQGLHGAASGRSRGYHRAAGVDPLPTIVSLNGDDGPCPLTDLHGRRVNRRVRWGADVAYKLVPAKM